MTENALDDKLLQDYLAESNEHLATIEVDLWDIEQAGSAIDELLVNRVFSAARSIKWGAGFFDLTIIRELAQKTGNVLDLIYSRRMDPKPEAVSVLLLAFGKLRNLLRDHRESNQADISELVDALTRLATNHLTGDQKRNFNQRIELCVPKKGRQIAVSGFDLSQARRGGKSIYLIEYDLIHDVQRHGMTPLAVFKCLAQCGEILETAFDLDSAGTLDTKPAKQLLLEVLYATVLEPDEVNHAVDVPKERIWLIERNGQASPLVQPGAGSTHPIRHIAG